jgi:hypothetical protein
MKQMEVFDEYYKKNPFWVTPNFWISIKFFRAWSKGIISMYEPLEVVSVRSVERFIAEPKELIRISKSNIINSKDYWLFRFNRRFFHKS